METAGFSGKKAAEIAGITYRQLDHWARTELLTPSIQEAHGSGSRRQYSYPDLVKLRIIKKLRDTGLPMPRIRAAVETVADLGENLGSAQLVVSGNEVFIVRESGEILEVVNRGQGALFVPLEALRNEVGAAIVELGLTSPVVGDGNDDGSDDRARLAGTGA
ncbi:MAG TPA: MerR family transcriptional regulator [Acidimicrobiales bacterium]|jgi:DNA-binding transcriptional MerR regulator